MLNERGLNTNGIQIFPSGRKHVRQVTCDPSHMLEPGVLRLCVRCENAPHSDQIIITFNKCKRFGKQRTSG